MAPHRVYMSFMLREGWHCQFLDSDLKTPLPRRYTFSDVAKVRELVTRGNGFPDQSIRQEFEHAVETGRGGVYLALNDEQYAKLKR
jgi:hypothetical protein